MDGFVPLEISNPCLVCSIIDSNILYIFSFGTFRSSYKAEEGIPCFLRGMCFRSKGLRLVSWEWVCMHKSHSGLGLLNLVTRQKAFHCILAMQVILNLKTLWVKLVYAKYKFLTIKGHKDALLCRGRFVNVDH